jgi:hypothetical protein
MADDRREKSRTIDREFVVTILTWEEQQRRRRWILHRLRGLARRFAVEDAAAHRRLRERV